MKIKVTAGEVSDHGDWDVFCEITGIGYWAMKEGQLDSSEEFEFTPDQIRKLGMSRLLSKELE